MLPWEDSTEVDCLRQVIDTRDRPEQVEVIVVGTEAALTPLVRANFPVDFRILTLPGNPGIAELKRQGALVASGDLIRFIDLVRLESVVRDGRTSEDRLRSIGPEQS